MSSTDGAVALLATYYLALGLLSLYGLHRLVLVFAFVRTRRRLLKTPRPLPSLPSNPNQWPMVTVQLPLYNEMYVASRLIDSVAALDYPRSRLEIQVLDDSTDETTEIVAAQVAELAAQGLDIHHLHRTDRTGFKAGALAAGLAVAKGDLLAIFDADFVPHADFLRRTVPHFQDSRVGMVQGSWTHINRDYSLLTRVEAILLDGHFQIEHTARHRSGCFFNFNGTAGVWRRAAIVGGGGWQHDTLTEDLDLSYRSQLAGWNFVYLPELGVPSELPVDVAGFKSQQYRWAKGSVQTGRKLLGRILASSQPLKVKLEAFVHLTNNGSYLLTVLVSLLVFPAMILRRGGSTSALLWIDLPLFLAATLSVICFYVASQTASNPKWRNELWYLPALMGLGIGLSLNNARAVVSGFFQRGGTFHRTPKYRIEKPGQEWRGKRYRVGNAGLSILEGVFALYFVFAFGYAVKLEMWLSLPFLWLFLQGYGYMFLFSVLPRLRRQPKEPPTLSLSASGSEIEA